MENKLEEIKRALESFSIDRIEEKEIKEKEKIISIDIDSSHIDWNSILSNSLGGTGNTISTAASQSGPWTWTGSGGAGSTVTGGGGGAGSSGSYSYSFGGGGGGTSSLNWSSTQPTLQVSGDAEFEGDIKWRGQSLVELLKAINNRLAILVPDPAKLEHFESLKKAYDHYKTLEALCELPTKKEK